jgi:phage protein D
MGDQEVASSSEDITPWVNAVSLVEDDRQADNVTITIPDPRMIYADALFEGSYVEVDLGYADEGQHALMLRAIITKVELNYPENGVPTLSLKGEDKSILMGLEEKRKLWRNRAVSDIVRTIGQEHGFPQVEVQLDPDPNIRTQINQDGKTDLAFLQELAQTYHAKCFVELNEAGEEVLYFIPERRIIRLHRPETLALQYRNGPHSNLISFSPSFDSSYIDRRKQMSDVDNQGNNIQSRQPPPAETFLWTLNDVYMARANQRDRDKIHNLYNKGAASRDVLQRRLTAPRPVVGEVANDQTEIEEVNDSLEGRRLGMTASGSTFGNIWLRAKSNVQIRGVSNRFDGQWYVSNVTHKIDSGGYTTDFKCVR